MFSSFPGEKQKANERFQKGTCENWVFSIWFPFLPNEVSTVHRKSADPPPPPPQVGTYVRIFAGDEQADGKSRGLHRKRSQIPRARVENGWPGQQAAPPPFNDRCVAVTGRCAYACQAEQTPMANCTAEAWHRARSPKGFVTSAGNTMQNRNMSCTPHPSTRSGFVSGQRDCCDTKAFP